MNRIANEAATLARHSNSPAMLRAFEMIDEAAQRHAATQRLRERTERRKRVNRYMADDGYWPLMAWLSAYPAERRFLSIDEAIRFYRREFARLANARAAGHWSVADKAFRCSHYRDRMIVARYFSRYGVHIWAREAA